MSKVLVTGGVFDILHSSHKDFLISLVEEVDPDNIILLLSTDKRANNKGSTRPYFTYSWREYDLIKWFHTKYPKGITLDIIPLEDEDNKEILSPYINKPNYTIGLKESYKDDVEGDNIIYLREGEKHTTEIAKALFRMQYLTHCTAIKVGALLVREGEIISAACNGNWKLNEDTQEIDYSYDPCIKCVGGVLSKKCEFLHAEEVVLRRAIKGDYIICTHSPCISCAKQIVEKGISRVVYLEEYVHKEGINYLYDKGVLVRQAGL